MYIHPLIINLLRVFINYFEIEFHLIVIRFVSGKFILISFVKLAAIIVSYYGMVLLIYFISKLTV